MQIDFMPETVMDLDNKIEKTLTEQKVKTIVEFYLVKYCKPKIISYWQMIPSTNIFFEPSFNGIELNIKIKSKFPNSKTMIHPTIDIESLLIIPNEEPEKR